MKKIAVIVGWIIIAVVIYFMIDFVRVAAKSETPKLDWGIVTDNPLRR